jgi:CRP/FNR family transcriptional regulator, cyclic AMP receptor protein
MVATSEELRAIPLFAELSDADLDTLAPWFEARTLGAGTQLIGEGSAGYSFFVLAAGTAVVTSEGAELAHLGPGDFFGEMAILGDGRRRATVTTISPTKVLVLFGTEFRRLEQTHSGIAAEIRETMERRLSARG